MKANFRLWEPARLVTARIQRFVFWIGLAVVGSLSLSVHPFNSDEGVILNGAWELLHGAKLYVDVFEMVGPGSFYVVWGMWTLVGESYFSARAISTLAVVVAALGVLGISRLAVPARPAYLASLLFFIATNGGPLINHNAIALAAETWAGYFAVRGLGIGKRRDLFAAGMLCGMTALVVQHKGVLLLAGIGAAGALLGLGPGRGRRHLVSTLGALLGGFLLALVPLVHWPVGDLIECLFTFPLSRYSPVNKVPPWSLIALAAASAWVLSKSAAMLGRSQRVTLACIQAALLVGCIPRPDTMHLIWSVFPICAFFESALRSETPPNSAGARGSAIRPTFLLKIIIGAVGASISAVWLITAQLDARSSSGQDLVRAIFATCGPAPRLYAGPFVPGLYFETRTRNLTRYSILLENFNSDRQFSEARDELIRFAPTCVVLGDRLARKFDHTGRNPVDMFLADAYRLGTTVGSFRILLPRERAGPAR